MRQSRCGSRLGHEALAKDETSGQVRREHLDGDVPIELHVPGTIHHPSPSTQLPRERGVRREELGYESAHVAPYAGCGR